MTKASIKFLGSSSKTDTLVPVEEIGVIDMRLLNIFRRTLKRPFCIMPAMNYAHEAAIYRDELYWGEYILLDDLHKGEEFIKRFPR